MELVQSDILLKARPATEGDERFVYCEPSNDRPDMAREVVQQEALAESAAYFARFGNLDIEHKSDPFVARELGLKYPREFEIGRPVEVRTEPHIMVKGVIYRGAGAPMAEQFWSSLTQQDPPMPWWPSVGGRVLHKSPTGLIDQVIWNNIGFSPRPVNLAVPPITTLPPGAFFKALVAGAAGTDTAVLSGGAALRRESLHGAGRDRDAWRRLTARLIHAIQTGRLGTEPSPAAIAEFFVQQGVPQEDARDYAERAIAVIGRTWREARQRPPHPQQREAAAAA